jgi:hypothetical protein
MWSTWRGPPDPVWLSKLCASRAAYPRRFARRCGFTRWRSPPLRGRRGEQSCRTPGTTHRNRAHEQIGRTPHIAAHRGSAHRIRRTRTRCAPPALCGAGVRCAPVSGRPWGFDGGAGNRAAGRHAYSTERATKASLRRTGRSRPNHHAKPHAWACRWTGSWLSLGRAVLGRKPGAIAGPLDDQLVGGVRQAIQGAIAQKGIVKEGQPLVHAAV